MGGCELDSFASVYGPRHFCEHIYKSLGSTECGEHSGDLNNYCPYKTAPWTQPKFKWIRFRKCILVFTWLYKVVCIFKLHVLCLLRESIDFSTTICEQLTHKIRESQQRGFDSGLPCQPVEYNPSDFVASTCL
jgi:hypothetical protein